MPIDASAISGFWTWFRANDAKLKAMPNADHPFWDTALAQLQLVHRGLRFEMSDPVRGRREFVITAEGDAKLFPLADAMVAAAPVMDAWTFVALKPAMGFDFTHQYEGVVYDPKSMWFLPLGIEGRPEALGLLIGVPSLRDLDQDGAEFAVTIILETGLGGRLDATNVSRPVVSVITSISLDHMAILGPTVRHIATEKAGIIKRGCPVVCGARDPSARKVIVATARQRRAPLRLVDRDFTVAHAPGAGLTPLAGGTLLLRAGSGSGAEHAYPLLMAGRHQADNAALAVMAIGELRRRGFRIPEKAVCAGLAAVHLPARIERIADRPLVILDAAHNVASMESLVETLEAPLAATAGRAAPRVLLFAASADKQIEEMLACCRGQFDRVVVTRYLTNPRAATTERLVAACAAAGLPVPTAADSPSAALAIAKKLAGARGLVCIAGSFFLATEIGAG